MNHPGGSLFTVPFPPKGWHMLEPWGEAYAFAHKCGLRVLVDCEVKEDGKRWLHVSYSRQKWAPSHEDTRLVKEAFIGDRYAYVVFPPESQYVNIHPNCLHLWALAEGDGRVLPEFSAVIEGVGRSI